METHKIAMQKKRGIQWTNPTLELILGCGLVKFKHDNGKTMEPGSRMYQIVISESARLIWKIRCNWQIQKGSDSKRVPTKEKVQRKWQKALGEKIKLDCLATNTKKYRKGSLNETLCARIGTNTIQEHIRPQRA